MTFRREDGVAENFHVRQNRELLEKLSSETGPLLTPRCAKNWVRTSVTRMWHITVRETRDLWDMPVIFLALLGLRWQNGAAAQKVG